MIGIRTVLPLCMALSFFAGNCVMPGAVAGGMLDGAASASQEPVLPGLASSSRNGGFERQGYVGDKACATCHRREAEAYARTGHRLSSQWPSSHSILGNFDAGANLLVMKQASQDEPGLSSRMDRSSSGFYETAVIGWPGASTKLSERIDVVIGSGRRGQTYLFWKADRLFELPVSFWTKGRRWINSPGYEDGSANFSRPAIPRCLDCHATYVQPLSPEFLTNRYVPSTLVLGIGCETCHGPGGSHVRLHLGNLRGKANASENILNPNKFSRERQIDLCALCHNGSRQEQLRAVFTYQPGDDLNRYLMSDSKVTTVPDVHGDQVGPFADESLLPVFSEDDLLHLSRRSRPGAAGRPLFCKVPRLPPGSAVRGREENAGIGKQLHRLPYACSTDFWTGFRDRRAYHLCEASHPLDQMI